MQEVRGQRVRQEMTEEEMSEVKDRDQWARHSHEASVREVLSPRRICRPVLRKAGSRAAVKNKKKSQGKGRQAETQMRTAEIEHQRERPAVMLEKNQRARRYGRKHPEVNTKEHWSRRHPRVRLGRVHIEQESNASKRTRTLRTVVLGRGEKSAR